MSINISYSRIWSIAYPIILGSVAQNLINITDTAFLGRVGEVELGASALGGMFYLVLIMMALGFGTGTQIIISRRHGEGNGSMIGKTFDHALYLLMPLALLSFLVLFWFADDILRPVIGSDAIYTATIAFLDFRMYGIFFAFGQILFRSFYIGIAKTRVITYSTIVMAAVNIVLDYALIFGKFGLPEMGIKGAALASVIAEFSALSYLMIYIAWHGDKKKYQLFAFDRYDNPLFLRNLKLAAPIMLQNFLSLGTWFAFFLFVEKLGEQSLAISNIIRSVYILLMIPIWGFSAAANSMVSYLIGMRRNDLVFSLIGRIVLMTTGSVAALVLFSFVFPTALLSVFTNDVTLITNSIPVLIVVNVSALFIASGFVLFNGVMGTGKTNVSFVIEVIVLFFYLAFVYVLIHAFNANVTVVWTSEILYGVLLSALSLWYLKNGNWLKSKV